MSPEQELTVLRPLARQFPTLDAALAEVARLSAERTLPKGTVHVISDIHGDDTKLRHVINNASGQLRPLLEQMFAKRLPPEELQELISLVFYPRETIERVRPTLKDIADEQRFCRRYLRHLFEIVRTLAPRRSRKRALAVFPPEFSELLQEMLQESTVERGQEYYDELIDALVRHRRALHLMHLTVRVIRNLAIDELVIGGDCWDRGPRGDRVVEYISRQPNVAFIWGNHDTAWLGACLGQEACIAHVLRISLRYRRLSQLEEGYGINLQPLEHLARTVYQEDPAASFPLKNIGLREAETMARMQKAAAMMQFKLEGQMIERNPQWGLASRRLLHRMDPASGTIEIDGTKRTLKDTRFPTLDAARPYELSAEERTCLDRIKKSFYDSEKLWGQVQYLVSCGSMYLTRDNHLIFHGCVPVDAKGDFLPLEVDGKPYAGRALFDVLDNVIARILDRPSEKDKDLMWYLWCGPRSPLFGKDRITTLENDLVKEPETHVETKNPYFQLIHEVPFCDKVLKEFDVDTQRGLIVNGHVPVKIEKGESPLKRSGKAITIDGAFSEAYGDHGYTLVLESDRTLLAKHHHFESVQAAVERGVDIIPTVTEVRHWDRPRKVAETERGRDLDLQIAYLNRLVQAYRTNRLREGV
ncbi:MAG: fructose-bisphosphatase class III [Planctomycetes bacterium]|nr:fructose-bisphosphatase class III [Planctomycetota bacterium]